MLNHTQECNQQNPNCGNPTVCIIPFLQEIKEGGVEMGIGKLDLKRLNTVCVTKSGKSKPVSKDAHLSEKTIKKENDYCKS